MSDAGYQYAEWMRRKRKGNRFFQYKMDYWATYDLKDSYQQILGKPLEELRADWIEAVESMEQEYTSEQINKIEEDFLYRN